MATHDRRPVLQQEPQPGGAGQPAAGQDQVPGPGRRLERRPEPEERAEREREEEHVAGPQPEPGEDGPPVPEQPVPRLRACRATAAAGRTTCRTSGAAGSTARAGSVRLLPYGGCSTWSAASSALVVNGTAARSPAVPARPACGRRTGCRAPPGRGGHGAVGRGDGRVRASQPCGPVPPSPLRGGGLGGRGLGFPRRDAKTSPPRPPSPKRGGGRRAKVTCPGCRSRTGSSDRGRTACRATPPGGPTPRPTGSGSRPASAG